MSFEIQLIKESLSEEIERTKKWNTSWNNGRIEGLEYALGLIEIALEPKPKEVCHADTEN